MRCTKGISRLLVAAFCVFVVCAGSGPLHADSLADLLAIANKIQNQTPGIGFEMGTEGEKTTFQISDPVAFVFKADRDCYLAMINIGTSGQTTLLFPNKWQTDNKIQGGKTYRIPPESSDYAFKLMGPPGTEHVKVIASLEPLMANVQSLQEELRTPVEQGGAPRGTFLTMKNPGAVLKDIGIAVAGVDPSKWATVELTFPVVEAAAAVPPPAAPSPSPGPASPESAQPPAGK